MKHWLIIGLAIASWSAVPVGAEAATLFFSPSSATYSTNQTFTITLKVNTSGQAVNAADGAVTFPIDLLDFQSASKSSSVFSLWTTNPTGSDSTGRVNFSGGQPSPGFTGSNGTVMTMTFRVKAPGTAQLGLTGARVLANDGQGTNVLTSSGSASYTLNQTSTTPTTPTTPSEPSRTTPTLTSISHPDQQAWYRDLDVTADFTTPSGLLGVSYGVTDQPNSVPDEAQDAVGDDLRFTLAGEGIWYLHLRGRYSNGWSDTAHYRIQIDRTDPETFTIELERDRGDDDATPTLTWQANDALSGVATYQLSLNDGAEIAATSPYHLNLTKSGPQQIEITAEDRAGNRRTSQLSFTFAGYPAPIITSVTRQLILLEPLVIKGTAAAGDLVTLYLNDDVIGQVTAGPELSQDSFTVRVPWSFTTDQIFRPGTYAVTATATNPDGLVSPPTNPIGITIVGTSLRLGGQPLLTLAVVPTVAALLLLVLVTNALILIKVYLLLRRMHGRELRADQGLHDLERQLLRGRVSNAEVIQEIEEIESELEGKNKRPPRRRRKTAR